MRLPIHRGSRRAGFTLVEVLVVMLIIAILVTITAAGVMRFLEAGDQTKARTEISQLEMAIGAFKSKYGVDYLPNSFIRKPAYNTADPIQAPSAAYLKKMWPRIDLSKTGLPDDGTTPLTGNQCLIFFLGGYYVPVDNMYAPTGPAVTGEGFSTDARYPFLRKPTTAVVDPFYEFPADRLDPSTGQYLDPWGTPYAYMTAINRKYNSQALNQVSGTPAPYQESATKFMNPQSFQIISAGPDQAFGAGGTTWSPSTAFSYGPPGEDDIANFRDRPLGAE